MSNETQGRAKTKRHADGFVAVPTPIMEALITRDLTALEVRMILLVVRQTSGWHKPEDAISRKQFAEKTGTTQRVAKRYVDRLCKRAVLGRKMRPGIASLLFVNPPQLWQVAHRTVAGHQIVTNPGHDVGADLAQTRPSPGGPTKESVTDNQQKGALRLLSRFPNYKPRPNDLERLEHLAADFPDIDLEGEIRVAAEWCAANPLRAWKDPILGLRRWLLKARETQKAAHGQEPTPAPAVDRAEIARQDEEAAQFRQRMKLE